MNQLSRFISLHPYFKVPSDKMPHLKAILPEFAAKTRNETGNLFYEFTINGDEVFCREGVQALRPTCLQNSRASDQSDQARWRHLLLIGTAGVKFGNETRTLSSTR